MTTAEACEDCGQPATASLGTVALCAACKRAFQDKILARRPDLRPVVGHGEIVGPTRDDGWPDGFASLRCSLCGAGWTGPGGEECWWCQERLRGQQRHQEEIEATRLRDYCLRLAEGDVECLAAAVALAKKVKGGDTLVTRALEKGKAA